VTEDKVDRGEFPVRSQFGSRRGGLSLVNTRRLVAVGKRSSCPIHHTPNTHTIHDRGGSSREPRGESRPAGVVDLTTLRVFFCVEWTVSVNRERPFNLLLLASQWHRNRDSAPIHPNFSVIGVECRRDSCFRRWYRSGSFPDTVVPVKQKIRSIRRHISLFQIGQQICRCRKPPQLKS
jgi:hypothetical protein